MSGLKELRGRIQAVRSTRRITSAMKMVAAAKLRRAQANALSSRQYGDELRHRITTVASEFLDENGHISPSAPTFLRAPTPEAPTLSVVLSTDRGLCGAFNTNLLRTVRSQLQHAAAGHIILVGRKASQIAAKEFADQIYSQHDDLVKPNPEYAHAQTIAADVLRLIDAHPELRVVLYFNRFVSTISQVPTPLQLYPLAIKPAEPHISTESISTESISTEPEATEILQSLLVPYVTFGIYQGLLDSFAGEQAARMTAMENATRNASEMIDDLTLLYNRTRQAAITKELIEIIAGAETL